MPHPGLKTSNSIASPKTQGDELPGIACTKNLRPQHIAGQWHVAVATQVDCYYFLLSLGKDCNQKKNQLAEPEHP